MTFAKKLIIFMIARNALMMEKHIWRFIFDHSNNRNVHLQRYSVYLAEKKIQLRKLKEVLGKR